MNYCRNIVYIVNNHGYIWEPRVYEARTLLIASIALFFTVAVWVLLPAIIGLDDQPTALSTVEQYELNTKLKHIRIKYQYVESGIGQ